MHKLNGWLKILSVNSKHRSLIILVLFFITLSSCKTQTATPFEAAKWKEVKIDASELIKWKLLGQGKAFNIINGQTCLMESDESLGVMLVSLNYYPEDVVLRYKALALTPSTVFVSILSASDTLNNVLEIPEKYDGGMQLWTEDVANYFFAFKNSPHGGTPFIVKKPRSAKQSSALQPDNMLAGIYYDIEAGKSGKKLWLSVNGQKLVDMQDEKPLKGGYLAFRLRGTAGLKAAALIRDLRIYTK